MATNNIFLADAMKSFDFSPWGGIEGFLEASRAQAGGNTARLKQLLPDLARAVDMTAVAISGLPFDILDIKTGDVFDTSEDWKNLLGGMPNPQRLIYLLASSLCGGAAYLVPYRTPKMIFDLQYVMPSSIVPIINQEGLERFDRMMSNTAKPRKYKPKELIYFWLPDSDVELGPAENNPLKNAALDAQLIWNMKNTMKIYGERGFVPITLLGAKGMPNEQEREKAESFFNRLLSGGFNVLAKIVNSEALSLIRVGAGMDELKQSYTEIKRDSKEGIADAFGIPSALFMSDNAFASEYDALRKQWYTASRFVGIYQTIEETFTDQLYLPYGYKLQFNLQKLEIFQEDESNKSNSLKSFVDALVSNPRATKFAMQVLGFDLTDAQIQELNDLAGIEEPPVEVTEPEPPPPVDLENLPEDNPPKALTSDDLKDLALWHDKAKAWFKKDKGRAVDWENKHLPEEIAAPIRLKLATAETVGDIDRAFNLVDTWTPAPVYSYGENGKGLDKLVKAIEKAVNSEEPKRDTHNYNFSMPPNNVNVNVPERETIVNVPEQKTPVVNVEAPNVEVKPEINVEPPVNNINVPEQKTPTVNITNNIEMPEDDVETEEVKPKGKKK